ncbi:hypothetical protein [Nostoc sp. UHCC 0252]|uniref:hypothetical protein n=1 Tax=Nostoc sp. UHCC 0252 TaxID=3110241 RepID=UPI002B1FF19B|nr:hypothetical protein [Nostoc sp. UHCC 0252]MEA5603461.1 hypothetical protein [Nostoc sp. UHCC 0252]
MALLEAELLTGLALGLEELIVDGDEQAANSKLRHSPVIPTIGKTEEENNLCWLLDRIFLYLVNDIHLAMKRRNTRLIIKMISLN